MLRKQLHVPPLGVDTILVGDAFKTLKDLPDAKFQCCITSPPYWGLRDYNSVDQIGGEANLGEYLERLREIFRQVYRVLRPTGTLWLNVGDSYTSGNRGWRARDKRNPARFMSYRPPTPQGLKDKELVGVPWRLAFQLQQDGWFLRSDVIWAKANAQPESVKDRPTRSHEYVFLLSKSKQYYYNQEAVQEPALAVGTSKNRRSVWNMRSEPFPGAHFATFPTELVRLCVLAASRPTDIVLDPFFGSGTVGLVCMQERRGFQGIELNPDYAEVARERLSLSPLQVHQFGSVGPAPNPTHSVATSILRLFRRKLSLSPSNGVD